MNYYGAYTLYLREVKRFAKVYHQSLIAPTVSAMIFLAIFSLASPNQAHFHNIPFRDYIGYGLIIMTILQNAFANSSSSLIMSKVIGYISDILIPPLGPKEIIIAMTLASICRGILTGIILAFTMSFFINYHLYHFFHLLYFVIISAMIMGLLGILTGLATSSFDQNAAVYSYLITPLSFLSGTFYSTKNLPMFFQAINTVNPFYYMIDGFRFALTNFHDSNINMNMGYLGFLAISLSILTHHLIKIGYGLKN